MYTIYFENQVESLKIHECDTLESAKSYCEQITKGREKKKSSDNTPSFERLHIYEGEPVEMIDDEPELKDPIFSTNSYYDLGLR